MTTADNPTSIKRNGPFESKPSAQKLEAHVVSSGTNPTLQGYALYDDLACHYAPSDLELLSLSGELPSESQGRAFCIARMFMMAPHPGSASNQAASIAHMLNTDERATIMVAVQMCSNEAFDWAAKQASVLDWLTTGNYQQVPDELVCHDKQEANGVSKLMERLGADTSLIGGINVNLILDAALTSVFYFCGLRTISSLQTVRCMSTIPAVVAQGLQWRPDQLMEYPTQLPDYLYQADATTNGNG